ncbi:MAG: two-component system response regulator [Planctomycetes bacterium GWA2_40_7]|nr:MAG: two-component system response regulator [Planctomycetes bacterium GWA2_40_7]OHB74148.1 MAG: two-component system response regulator [Planctomycetes bacterium RBG_16_41_13]
MVKPKRILVVDDDEQNRELLVAMLEALGYETEFAIDGFDALGKLSLDIDLVLLDVMMPGMDGFEVTRKIRSTPPYSDLPVVMVTALTSKEDRIRAVEVGANDFISKPIDKTELTVRTVSLLKMKEHQDTIKQYQKELEDKVEKRTADLRTVLSEKIEAHRRIYQAHLDTINRLVIAAEYKDEDTADHIKRMSNYCALLAKALKLTPQEIEVLYYASSMHDVGKIGIPDHILLKPGKHNPEEWEIMKQHTTIGGYILDNSPSELLQSGEIIALSHHEKWDGSGYPKGLSGENIPLLGRICAVTDVYDALTSKRPYKEAFSNEKSLEIMKEGSGKHFDPNLISIFFNNLDEVFAIQKKFKTGVPLKENERFSPEYPEFLRQIISETKTIR